MITDAQAREQERKVIYPKTIKNAVIERLTKERKKISDELAELENKHKKARISSSKEVGKNHMADLDFFYSNNLALLEKEIGNRKKRLQKIRKALLRLSGGRYGICEKCDQDIGIARLTAIPWADKCTPCKEAKNKRERAAARIYAH